MCAKTNGSDEFGEQVKRNLLEHYGSKDPHSFYQYDMFSDAVPDDVVWPDKDGDALFISSTLELMSSCPTVRVLVPAGASYRDVVRCLRKVADWLEEDTDLMWRKQMLKRHPVAAGSDPVPDPIPF